MDWYRRYSNAGSHPQIVRAGFWGRAVFDALCDASAEFDLGGELPGQYTDPGYLALRMGLTKSACMGGDPEAIIKAGLASCVKAGLLREEHGLFIIDGWERRQPKIPTKSTKRVQAHRARKRQEEENQDVGDVKRDETSETRSTVSETVETSRSPLLSSQSLDSLEGAEFFAWAQEERTATFGGFPEMGRPAGFEDFWQKVSASKIHGDRLRAAYRKFLGNAWVREQGAGFALFATQWPKYVPPETPPAREWRDLTGKSSEAIVAELYPSGQKGAA